MQPCDPTRPLPFTDPTDPTFAEAGAPETPSPRPDNLMTIRPHVNNRRIGLTSHLGAASLPLYTPPHRTGAAQTNRKGGSDSCLNPGARNSQPSGKELAFLIRSGIVPLSARVAPGETTLSPPVFVRLPANSLRTFPSNTRQNEPLCGN